MVALSEDMSVSDVGNWLNYHGFCEEVQECFKSRTLNLMDIVFSMQCYIMLQVKKWMEKHCLVHSGVKPARTA